MNLSGFPAAAACLAVVFSAGAAAAPTLTVEATGQAEKAHTFEILATIETGADTVTNGVVSLVAPEGFAGQVLPVPGVTRTRSRGDGPSAHLEPLAPQSRVTVPIKIWPPDWRGNPREGEKRAFYTTTRPMVFTVNLAFDGDPGRSDSVRRVLSQSLPVRYTTTIGFYLLSGLLGVLLGYFAKTATLYREEVGSAMGQEATIAGQAIRLGKEIFVTRFALMVTLLVIGFGVLLGLAQEELPVTSWHQAIALGMGVGILGDEQLMSKFKTVP